MKGLFAWLGYRTAVIDYTRAPRHSDTTSWGYWRLWNLALEGFTSFSTAPLRLWTYVGAGVAVLAFLYATFIVLRTLIPGRRPARLRQSADRGAVPGRAAAPLARHPRRVCRPHLHGSERQADLSDPQHQRRARTRAGREEMTSWIATLIVLVIAAALKLTAWAVYGPVYFNDTHLYEAFADYLLQEDWSWQYREYQQTFPVTMLRTAGYPAVIAGAKIIAGDGWQNLVVALQIAVSLVTLLIVMRWTRTLCQSTGKAVFVGLAVATGQTLLYDLALLPGQSVHQPDGLHAVRPGPHKPAGRLAILPNHRPFLRSCGIDHHSVSRQRPTSGLHVSASGPGLDRDAGHQQGSVGGPADPSDRGHGPSIHSLEPAPFGRTLLLQRRPGLRRISRCIRPPAAAPTFSRATPSWTAPSGRPQRHTPTETSTL